MAGKKLVCCFWAIHSGSGVLAVPVFNTFIFSSEAQLARSVSAGQELVTRSVT